MNEVATTNRSPVVDFKRQLDGLNQAGELALPSTVDYRAFKNAAIVAVTDNPGILQMDRAALFKAIRTLAGAGLVPDGREAALVPFKGKPQAMPMVAGLVKIARNSGKITSLWAEVVYEGEEFVMRTENGERTFDHNYDPMNRSGGDVRGAYAVAKLTDGTVEVLTMGRADIEKRRKASATQKSDKPTGIWGDWYEEMAKKTVIRAICKTLPMSSDDMERLMKEQEPLLKDVTPEPEAPRRNLAQRLQEPDPAPDDPAPPETQDGHWTDAVDTDNGAPMDDSWDEGVEAAKAGEPRTSCPHDEDMDAAASWLAGFDKTPPTEDEA